MRISAQEIYSSVSRSAIDDDVFPVPVILGEHTFDGFAQRGDSVERGRHHRNLRRPVHDTISKSVGEWTYALASSSRRLCSAFALANSVRIGADATASRS